MRKPKIPGDRVITSALAFLLLAGTSISFVSAGQSDAPPRGVAVYVRDFEMSVAPAEGFQSAVLVAIRAA